MEKKTKILAVGDIHGDTGLVKKLAQRVKKENVDLIILAGDLTLAERSIKNIVGPLAKTKKPVLIIPGNHESTTTIDFLTEMYSAKNIHGEGFRKNDLGIFGAGGGDIIIYTPDKEILRLLHQGHENIKDLKKKIMVTHMHPYKSKSEFSGFKGSRAVRKAVEKFKPDFLLHAHIHEASGIEEKIGKTKVINIARKGKIFEI